jgi:predicted transcriptional regulator
VIASESMAIDSNTSLVAILCEGLEKSDHEDPLTILEREQALKGKGKLDKAGIRSVKQLHPFESQNY